jgi:hypothetical protein
MRKKQLPVKYCAAHHNQCRINATIASAINREEEMHANFYRCAVQRTSTAKRTCYDEVLLVWVEVQVADELPVCVFDAECLPAQQRYLYTAPTVQWQSSI